MWFRLLFLILLSAGYWSCKPDNPQAKSTFDSKLSASVITDTVHPYVEVIKEIIDYDTAFWTELKPEDGFQIDLKYSSPDNFTEKIIYPCGRCFVRPQLATKLKTILTELQTSHGLSIKLFDCYRPRPAQQRLWDIMPDATYVANPAKGSMHNKGLAVDMTFVDEGGVELEMGSPFDHFGRESRHNYYDLPKEVLERRELLKETMEKHKFNSIKSEWWHYSLNGTGHKVSDWEWKCYD